MRTNYLPEKNNIILSMIVAQLNQKQISLAKLIVNQKFVNDELS